MSIRQSIVWIYIPTILIISVYLLRVPTPPNSLPSPVYSTDLFNLTQPLSAVDNIIFSDVTLQSGIQIPHTQRSEYLSGIHESLGSGACAFDYNNDGWIDLLTLNGSGTTHFYGKPQWWQGNKDSLTLYQNNQDDTFEDVTQLSQLSTHAWTMGCASADFDNDGDEDVFISNYGRNQLWRNNGDGTFTDNTLSSGINGNAWSTTVNVSDINNDGLVDIYVSNYVEFETNSLKFETLLGLESAIPDNFNPALNSGQPNQLWINQGNLTFVDTAVISGVDNPQGRSLSAHWFDIDNNHYPDLLIANDEDSANKVYLNQDGVRFIDISTRSRLAFLDRASNISISDFNNDGEADFFVATDNTLFPKLYSKDKSMGEKHSYVFNDVSDNYQLHYSTSINQSHWGSIASDFNLDGWVDLFIANGMKTPNKNAPLIPRGQMNTLLINDENASFSNANHHIAPNTFASFSSRCTLPLDFDNNGAPDIYVTQNNGLGQLLKNTSTNHQWIGISVLSNRRTAYGAKAILTIENDDKNTTIERPVGQSSFLCTGDQRIIFGLGDTTASDVDITIIWPDGEATTYNDLSRNHYHVLRQEHKASELVEYVQQNQASNIKLSQPKHRLEIVNWLIQYGRPELAKHELRQLMQHTDEAIRHQALTRSQQLPLQDQNAFTQMAINDDSKKVRLEAIGIIRMTENELMSRWLLKQLEHPDDDIACAVADSFAHFFDEEEAVLLHKYTALNSLIRLAQQPDANKQLCAINALGRSEKYRALEPLIELLNSARDDIRGASMKALGQLKDKAALPFLKSKFLSNVETVPNRSHSLIAIKQIDSTFDIQTLLQQALEPVPKKSLKSGFSAVIRYAYSEADNNILIRSDILTLINKFNLDIQLDNIAAIPYPSNNDQTLNNHTTSTFDCDLNNGNQTLSSHKNIATALEHCLSASTFYKTMPPFIKAGLARDNTDLHIAIFREVASRKERWARELSETTLYDAATSFAIQKAIVENLANPLSSSTLKKFKHRLNTQPDRKISPYLAKRLIRSGETDITNDIFQRLMSSLFKKDEVNAMGYSEALIDAYPDKVLDLLAPSENSIAN